MITYRESQKEFSRDTEPRNEGLWLLSIGKQTKLGVSGNFFLGFSVETIIVIWAHHGGGISPDQGGREEAEGGGDDEEAGEAGEEEPGRAQQWRDQVEVELRAGDRRLGGQRRQPGLGAEHHQAWPVAERGNCDVRQ